MQRKALKQLEKTEFLVASGKTQKSTVNDRLARVGPEIFGDEEAPLAPDWNQLQEWGIAALETSLEEVRATDREHRGKVVRLGKARKDRDDLFDQLTFGHRALRKSFSGTYGVNALPLIGLEAEPARALKAAREQMCEVVERMRDPQVAAELPMPLAGQRPIELEAVAEARHSEVDELEAKMAEIDELRKQVDEALIVRDQELKKNRRVYSNIGRLLEGVYRLAGLDELADRIRVTERTPRKKSEGESESQEAESTSAEAESASQPAPSAPQGESPRVVVESREIE